MKRIRYVDVSGVGNSGKGALVDILREIDNFFVPKFNFEFDFIRVRGGLLELRHHLLDDWSPIRSHAAALEFRRVVRCMGTNPHWWNLPELLRSSSHRYDRRFNGKFIELSEKFVESFIISDYLAEWPYDNLRENLFGVFLRKLLSRIGMRRQMLRKVLLLDSLDFDTKAHKYLDSLYRECVPSNCSSVVWNNGLEPFNPIPGLNMLQNSLQLVVTRDPRDVYVSGLNFHGVNRDNFELLADDNDGLNKSFLATDSIEVFCKRYRIYNEKLYSGNDGRVMHLSFESLVREYDVQVARILDFLGVPIKCHSEKGKYFDPNKSKAGVGVWRKYKNTEEINYIRNELHEYCSES